MEVVHKIRRPNDGGTLTVTTGVRSLVLVDDDDLSLAVLGLIADEAHFTPQTFVCGEDALSWIAAADAGPVAVVTDMQMPGIAGEALARQLRQVCPPETVILAMSGSQVSADAVRSFDGFLLKPFSAGELQAACQCRPSSAEIRFEPGAAILNDAVYENFARAMPPGQVAGLYQMCLDDAKKRLATMRQANVARDDAEYRRAAHAIKGGCGMVGALELAALAAAMEDGGLPALVRDGPDDAPLELFLAASARLGRMLELKASTPREIKPAV